MALLKKYNKMLKKVFWKVKKEGRSASIMKYKFELLNFLPNLEKRENLNIK